MGLVSTSAFGGAASRAWGRGVSLHLLKLACIPASISQRVPWSLVAPRNVEDGVSTLAYVVRVGPGVVDRFECVGDVAVEVAVFGGVLHDAYQPNVRANFRAANGRA